MRQADALTLLKMGKNVFLTGPAGTGKTYVLNSYIEYLQDRGVEVAVTASTGIAATHIGGMTIHSWAGIGIKDQLSARDLDHLEQQQYMWKRFEKVKVLFIDEISMLQDRTLDMVDRVCKTFKRSEKPFGGLQVILSGDFFQLPPIEKYAPQIEMQQTTLSIDEEAGIAYESEMEVQISTPFAFKARSWREAGFHVCYLDEQFRQDDESLLGILSEMRTGEVSDETRQLLLDMVDPRDSDHATKLFTHNMDVDRYNLMKLEEIEDEPEVYEMTSRGKASGVEALKRGCLSPAELALKIGARVMFTKNNPVQGYVNGTIGEIIDFDGGYPVIQTDDGRRFTAQEQTWAIEDQGKVVAEIHQLPLRLAWAITVHKSQGMTLDSASIDLSQAFVPGQGYVALSRLRTLDGLYLKGINRQALEVHPGVLEFDKKLREHSDISAKRLAITDAAKIEENCTQFLMAIGADLEPKKREKKRLEPKKNTYETTREAVRKKMPIKMIALEREISENTIYDHVDKLLDQKMLEPEDVEYLLPNKEQERHVVLQISKTFVELDTSKLKPVYEHFEEKYDYELIRLAKLFVPRE